MQSLHGQICVYTVYTYSLQYRDAGWAKEIKNGAAVSALCQTNLSVCHFGHVCLRFGIPVLYPEGKKVSLVMNLQAMEWNRFAFTSCVIYQLGSGKVQKYFCHIR